MAVMKNRVPMGIGALVWQVDKYPGGLGGMLARAKAGGVDWIWLKGADGGSIWQNQMTPGIVEQVHAAGFGVIGWQYVYGGPGNGAASWSTVQGEIDAAKYILSCGCDAYCFDNEVEFAGKGAIATEEWEGIRAAYPNASLGYNPYPFPSGAPDHPFFEFNSGCDWCSPQLYVGQDGLGTPAAALPRCLDDFAHWSPIWAARAGGRPAVPLIIDWQAASWPAAVQPDNFITEAAQVSLGKVGGITYWDLDSLTSGEESALAAASAIWHGTGGTTMAWTQQADKSGKDSAGHTCGEGDINYLAANGLEGSDGLMSETYYDGSHSFLPLADGRVVTSTHNADGSWSTGEQGAQALVAVFAAMQAAEGAVATDKAEVQQLQGENTTLTAEVASLQQQLAQLQASLSQQAQDALAAVAAVKKALAD